MRLYAKEYHHEFLTAKRFLARHRDHAGIRHALSFVADWFADACAAQSPSEAQRHLVRLHRHGVQPSDVLREVVAVHLFQEAHPQRFPTDRTLTFAFGIAVAFLAPMPSHDSYLHTRESGGTRRHYHAASAVAREQLGKEVRHQLSPLFVRIAVALADEVRHKAAREAAIAAPFVFTTHNAAPQRKRVAA